MKNRILKAFLLMTALLVCAASAWAQSAATAELHVTVKDPNGAVIRNASVTVTNEARNIERTLTANEEGEYQFISLPPGQYTVSVQAAGFAYEGIGR